MTNPGSEYEALAHVIERLSRHFPAVDEDVIRELVVEVVVGFDQPAVRTHIPVLAEGAVLRRLRDSARSGGSLAAGPIVRR